MLCGKKLLQCKISIKLSFLFLSSHYSWTAWRCWMGDLRRCPERSIPYPEYPVLTTHTKGLLPRDFFFPSHTWVAACSRKWSVVFKSLCFFLKRKCQENSACIFRSYWVEWELRPPVPSTDHIARFCQSLNAEVQHENHHPRLPFVFSQGTAHIPGGRQKTNFIRFWKHLLLF